MAETNQFNIEVGVDTKDSISKLKELGSTLESVASSVKGSTSAMSSSFSAMSAKLASSLNSVGSSLSIGITAPLLLLGKSALQTSAQMEQISVSFEVFTGSAEVAKEMLGELKDQAIKSPMQFQDITKGAQVLLGYGLTAEQVIPITKMLGDISGGNADKFARLSLAFGQVNAAGRLMGQEARQMINAGFNPLQAISDKTGVSMAVLTKRMKDGQISVKDVGDAFVYATSEGGRFFGMADRQSQTLQGSFNKLKESVTFALAEIGDALASKLSVNSELQKFSGFLTELKDKFLNLSPDALNFALKITGITVVIGPLMLAIGKLIQITNTLKLSITALSLSGGGFIKLLLTISATVLGAAYAQNEYNKVMRDAEKKDPELLKIRNKELREQVNLTNELIKRAPLSKAPQDVATQTKAELLLIRNNIINEINANSGLLAKMSIKSKPEKKLTDLSDKPPGLDKKTKVKQEPIEIITGTDFITKDEGSKIKRLIELNKDAALKISEIWLTGTEKKLAKLKSDYELEIQDYIKYQVDYTNITKKYEETRKQIIQQAQNERETAAVKAQLEELAGLQMSYPRSLDDFANDLLNNDLVNNLKNYGEAFYAATKDFNVNLAAGFADIAGNALVTGMSLQDTFKSLGAMVLSSLGDYLIKIGTAAIAAGTVGTILKAFFTGGAATVPELGIAGGMAAVAVGSAMKALSGKVSDSMSKTNMPSKSGSTASSVSSKASGASYQYGGASYSTQSVRLMVDLTGSITATQTGYSINKSLETTLRVTGR